MYEFEYYLSFSIDSALNRDPAREQDIFQEFREKYISIQKEGVWLNLL